jgi:hypothetical protein
MTAGKCMMWMIYLLLCIGYNEQLQSKELFSQTESSDQILISIQNQTQAPSHDFLKKRRRLHTDYDHLKEPFFKATYFDEIIPYFGPFGAIPMLIRNIARHAKGEYNHPNSYKNEQKTSEPLSEEKIIQFFEHIERIAKKKEIVKELAKSREGLEEEIAHMRNINNVFDD